MTAKKNKGKKVVPLDLDSCEPLKHVTAPPKSRSSSITSIESEDGTIEMILKPPPVREFDDIYAFESYIKDETWDNDYDYCHAKLLYYPPFIMKEVHDNLDKIKPTMNKNSRKFKRNLQHHIKKHLMADMEKCSGFKMDFSKISEEETPKNVTWTYEDTGLHGLPEEEEDQYHRHWKLCLQVTCNNESPLVEVDYMAVPIL